MISTSPRRAAPCRPRPPREIGWNIAQGVYFAFVAGLTIGYGDLAPSRVLTKTLAMVIGLLGLAVTGLVAALAVTAFEATPAVRERRSSSQVKGGDAGSSSRTDGGTR